MFNSDLNPNQKIIMLFESCFADFVSCCIVVRIYFRYITFLLNYRNYVESLLLACICREDYIVYVVSPLEKENLLFVIISELFVEIYCIENGIVLIDLVLVLFLCMFTCAFSSLFFVLLYVRVRVTWIEIDTANTKTSNSN